MSKNYFEKNQNQIENLNFCAKNKDNFSSAIDIIEIDFYVVAREINIVDNFWRENLKKSIF